MRPPGVALAVVLAACGGASEDPGLQAWLRVAGAQYAPGATEPGPNGPRVLALNLSRNSAPRGDSALHLSGALSTDANAVRFWLEGDRGAWLLPAGLPDVTLPNALSFAATAALSLDAPLGTRTLHVAAVSAGGEVGPSSDATLEVLPLASPTGVLVLSLSWDRNADLDLHVVDPNGVEVWAGNPNSWSRPAGAPPDPNAWRDGGLLDADSNGGCVIDGRNRENVVWQQQPPSGHYLVRVDTASLCGQAVAHWSVSAELDGGVVAQSTGTSTPADTRLPHELGAGVLARELEVP